MINLLIPSQVEEFPEPLVGTVEKTITRYQPGRVKCIGTYWPAQFYQPDCEVTLLPNQPVHVVAIQGITLLVLPVNLI